MKTSKNPEKTCKGCAHRLPYGTCAEPVAAGIAGEWGIAWAPMHHAETCPARALRKTEQPATKTT